MHQNVVCSACQQVALRGTTPGPVKPGRGPDGSLVEGGPHTKAEPKEASEVQLNAGRRDQLIDNVARRIDGWGLTSPAVALLETHKPLAFVASQALLAFQPLLTMFVGDVSLDEYVLLLEDRKNVERVICRLEDLQQELSTSE